jgi:hypothetical protein
MYNFSYIPGREYNKNGKCSKKAAGCDPIAHQEVSIEKALPFDFISFFSQYKNNTEAGPYPHYNITSPSETKPHKKLYPETRWWPLDVIT